MTKQFWVILFFFSLIIFGCQSKNKAENPPLKVINSAEPATLDLHLATGAIEFRIIGALFEGLVLRDPQSQNIMPGIAHKWDISTDKKKYTFHLRPSCWSNGKRLIANDFVRSWRRLADPVTTSEYSSLLNIVVNGNAIREKKMPVDSLGIRAVDDSTLVVNIEHPVEFFLNLCAFEPLFPLLIDSVNKYQERWTTPEHMIGNGPFRMVNWKRNLEINLEKNNFYWDTGSVKQEKILIKPVEDQLTAYNMFLSHEADWVFAIPPSKLEVAIKLPEYFSQPVFGTYYYLVNCKKKGFDSKALRKALAYAIDREKIVRLVLKGVAKSATGFVAPLPNYPSFTQSLFQPDSAKYYLAQAGYSKTNPPPHFEILYNNSETNKSIAEVVQQMWHEVLGLDAELVNYEWKVYLENTKNLNYSAVARASWFGDFPDPITFLELAQSTNGNNRSGYSNVEYDKKIQATWNIAEPSQRMLALQDCEKLLLEDMPIIPIYFYTLTELRNPKLKNAVPSPLGMYTWKNIHLEK